MAVSSPSSPPTITSSALPAGAPRQPGAPLVVGLVLLAATAMLGIDVFGLDVPRTTELAVIAVALAVAVAWLLAEAIAPAAPRIAWIGLVLLGLLGVWSGLSLLWSVTPGESWLWINRALVYALVVLLAFTCGASSARVPERLGGGLLGAITFTAFCALAGRALPAVFDDGENAARLAGPLGSPAALGLLCAIGAPLALAVCTDISRSAARRLAGLSALWLQVVVLLLAASRGAVLALLIGVAVLAWLRLSGAGFVAWLGTAVLAAAPAYALALTRAGLGENGTPQDVRVDDGVVLLLVLGAGLVALLAIGWALLLLERRDAVPRRVPSPTGRRVAMVIAAAAALAVIALAATSDGGVRGALERLRDDVIDDPSAQLAEPDRLGTPNADRRWDLWQAAAGMFSDKPVEGFGMGSFPNEHLRYRDAPFPAASARSQPMTLLAEGGVIGTLLATGALLLLMIAAILRVRSMPDGRERTLAGALAAGGTAWVFAGAWSTTLLVPGVTVPALLMLGSVAALAPDPDLLRRRRTLGLTDPGEPARVLALVAGVLALAALALSVALPARAELKARSAVSLSAKATQDQQQAAALDAAVASQLDPLSARGPIAEATVAVRRGRLAQARTYALDGVDRTPENAAAWVVLAEVARAQADRAGFTLASERALVLDPLGTRTKELATAAAAFEAPPAGSPTATGTPLTPEQDPLAIPPTLPDATTPEAVEP
jgi:MFS family permease